MFVSLRCERSNLYRTCAPSPGIRQLSLGPLYLMPAGRIRKGAKAFVHIFRWEHY